MQTELKAKLLQHFACRKKSDKGFTLFELLVAIIILGVLAAMALPAYLNQASKARQAEAKQTLGALVRGQQVYRLESKTFANRIDHLALGVQSQTKNYKYQSKADGTGNSGEFSDDSQTLARFAEIFGVAEDAAILKSYAGGIGISEDEAGNTTAITLLCESNKPTGQPDGVAAETTYTVGVSGTPAKIGCGVTDKVL